ncbi:MAG: Polysaccharide biosynthesis protein [Candidatus Gottesmanbacteria bacterium GW2011_GWA1_43_11]|uniref:Polysaccharide biosynthesis protein n=1 Tax=Candidatus Gottesmanbacteria bacterium GW2011_GWA1_43_11 TaxID=1618436 RepID=A0A0G1CKF4_9BACT|nr:MAG: Polysaccharide biosynthesis protein [Candidatus Gottesmanbacteria bacterium GW2011_GWA1_43_11]
MMRNILEKGFAIGRSTTARHIYWVFSGNVLSTVLTFFALVVVMAPRISKAEYGIFLALFTLANLLSDLSEAGLGGALTKFIPPLLLQKKASRAKEFLATAHQIELGITIVVCVTLLLLAGPLARILFAGTAQINVVITALMTATMILMGFMVFALSAYKKFPEVTVVNVFYSIIRLALLLVFALLTKLSLFNILIVYLLSSILSWIYSLFFLGTSWVTIPFSRERAGKIIRFASFLAVQKVFVAVSSRLDLLMMVPLAGAVEAGIYGMASRFALVYPLLISSLAQVLAPKFAELATIGAATAFFKKVGLVICGLLVSLIVFNSFARIFISAFVQNYSEAIPVLGGLLLSMAPFIAATPFVSFVVYTLKKPWIMMVASFVQLVVIFAVNWWLLPSLGRFAPATGIGLGNLTIFIIAAGASWYYFNQEKYENRH